MEKDDIKRVLGLYFGTSMTGETVEDVDGRAEFLDAVQEDSVFYDGASDDTERFTTLSTCDVSRRNGRVAIVGKQIT